MPGQGRSGHAVWAESARHPPPRSGKRGQACGPAADGPWQGLLQPEECVPGRRHVAGSPERPSRPGPYANAAHAMNRPDEVARQCLAGHWAEGRRSCNPQCQGTHPRPACGLWRWQSWNHATPTPGQSGPPGFDIPATRPNTCPAVRFGYECGRTSM